MNAELNFNVTASKAHTQKIETEAKEKQKVWCNSVVRRITIPTIVQSVSERNREKP